MATPANIIQFPAVKPKIEENTSEKNKKINTPTTDYTEFLKEISLKELTAPNLEEKNLLDSGYTFLGRTIIHQFGLHLQNSLQKIYDDVQLIQIELPAHINKLPTPIFSIFVKNNILPLK